MGSELRHGLVATGRVTLVVACTAMLAACSGSKDKQDGPSCLQGLYDCLDAQGDCVLSEAGDGQVSIAWENGSSVNGPVGLVSFEALSPGGGACFNKSVDGNQIVLEASGQSYLIDRSADGSVDVTCPDGTLQEHSPGSFPTGEVGIDPERLVSCRISGICSQDNDCPAGQVCCQDRCYEAERCPGTCDVDADCGQDNRCCDGLCTSLAVCQTPCSGSYQCDDGVYCNGAEICVANICQQSPPLTCSDGVDCTQDACDEGAHRCTHEPQDGQCGVDQRCDLNRGCEDIIACVDAGDCEDGDACTQESCVADICEFDEIDGCCRQDADCDDGTFCNGTETCANHACTAGQAPNCDDGIDCTSDSCDAARDECSSRADNDQCGAGDYCDVEQGCVSGDTCEDDVYEDNDLQADATEVACGAPTAGMLCPMDTDWYTTQLDGIGVPVLVVVMDPDVGAADVTWHSGSGTINAVTDNTTPGVILMTYLGGSAGETTWIEIKGETPDVAGLYLVIIDFEVE